MTVPTEHEEQVWLFSWAALMSQTMPELRLLYAIPNGGYRPKATATRLKSEGVRPGVPDICLPVPRNGYGALYIELKRRKGGKIEPEQEEWIVRLSEATNCCRVCRGWEAAREVIVWYLGKERTECTV